jgi:hypothetical protein
LEDPSIDEMTISKWILKKLDRRPLSGQGKVAGSCEKDNERSASMNCGISRLVEKMSAFQEGLRCMELFIILECIPSRL